MTRIDLYRSVHKGQRAHLFSLAVELGRTDPDEGLAIAALSARLEGAIAELRQHAANEERFIHPLLQSRAPHIAAALEREHEAVEFSLAALEDELRRLAESPQDRAMVCADLYRTWCRMLSAYLAHLDAEERQAMPALWQTCSDEEILGIIRSFLASRSAADQLQDVISQAPALAPGERRLLVGSILRSGSLPAEPVWAGLADVLPSHDLARLRADIGIGVG
jgi:iron-sulfur cluster repair protein YtfE (RIC family)